MVADEPNKPGRVHIYAGNCAKLPTTGLQPKNNYWVSYSQNTQTVSFSVPERRPEHTFLYRPFILHTINWTPH